MANYIDNYAESTRRILKDGVSEANDFVSLAIAGEQLRRASNVGDPSTDAMSALMEYESFLKSYEGDIPGELDETVQESLAELHDYSRAATSQREISRGQELLLELDELMSVVTAGARASLYEEQSPNTLGELAMSKLAKIAGSLSELGQFAEDREILFGSDSDFPMAFAWWDVVAGLAPSRMALQATVNATARKERIVQAAIANFAAKHEPSALASLAGAIRAQLGALTEGLGFFMPAAQASYSDDTSVPSRQRELFQHEGFTVLCDDKYLVFMVSNEHTLEPVDVRLSGAELETETMDSSSFRVSLPRNAGTIEVVIQIDGEELTLPAIAYQEPS